MDDPSDTESSPNTATDSLSCGELYNCEDSCNGNRDCGQACYDRGTATAQSQWTELIQCGQLMCDGLVSGAGEYRQCLQAYCTALYTTCFSESTSGQSSDSSTTTQSGSASCYDGYTCIRDCYSTATSESSFYSCVDACYSPMDSEAHTLMEDVVQCSRVECADVPGSIDNYYRCIEDFCPAEYQACLSDVAGSAAASPTNSSDMEGA